MTPVGDQLTPTNTTVNAVRDAKIFCGVLKLYAPYVAFKSEEVSFVMADDMIERLRETLDFEDWYIKAIYKTLVSVGLLSKLIDPDRKKEVMTLNSIEKLDDFLTLLRSTRLKKTQKLLEYHFADKTLRLGRALCLYAKHMNLKLDGKVTLTADELDKRLLKVAGTQFDISAIQPLFELELIEHTANSNIKRDTLVFNPQHLNRALTNVIAYRRLERLGTSHHEDGF